MPSVSELVEDVAAVMGERVENVNAYARALIDAGKLPKSRGRAVAQVTYSDIVKLLTVVALQPKIKDAAETISQYLSIDTGYMPWVPDPNLGSSAGEWLEAMLARMFRDNTNEAAQKEWAGVAGQQISFDTSWPIIMVSRPNGNTVIRFEKPNLKNPTSWCKRVAVVSCLGVSLLGVKSGRSYKTGEVAQ